MWERRDFGQYLRTGHFVSRQVELKFNPYHHPDDGRFTFAPGGSRLSASVGGRGAVGSNLRFGKVPNVARSNLPKRPTVAASPRPYLTSIHAKTNELGSRASPASGTEEWTDLHWVGELTGLVDDKAFKKQWVRGYRNTINKAASRYNLPPALLAGVAYKETSGDAPIFDSGQYTFRSSATRDQTSFGPLSVQLRTAANALGYESSERLSETQRRAIINSLEHPGTSIFVAAKHLSDLRDRHAKGLSNRRFSQQQIEALATLYNQGNHALRKGRVMSNDYGREVALRWSLLNKLLAP
jgi:hypothetical protein